MHPTESLVVGAVAGAVEAVSVVVATWTGSWLAAGVAIVTPCALLLVAHLRRW